MTIVHVRHPAPFEFVRRHCRDPELRHLRATTPVALREVDRAGLRPLPVTGSTPSGVRRPLHVFEDRLWASLSGDAGGRPARGALAEWLQGDFPDDRTGPAVKDMFLGSPLRVGGPHYFHPGREPGDIEPKVRRVVEDGRGMAAAALVRYFAENVVVAGDDVFVRCRGPLATLHVDAFAPRWEVFAFTHPGSSAIHVTPWGFEEAQDLLGRHGMRLPPPPRFLPLRDALSREWYGMEDDVVCSTRSLVASMACYSGATLTQARDDLEPWDRRQEIGALFRDHCEEALRAAGAVAEAVWADIGKHDRPSLAILPAYADEILLPRIWAAGHDDADDALALSGLDGGTAP